MCTLELDYRIRFISTFTVKEYRVDYGGAILRMQSRLVFYAGIGFDPSKEHDRTKNAREYIGEKTGKMQKRVKSYEERIGREIEEKEGFNSCKFTNICASVYPG